MSNTKFRRFGTEIEINAFDGLSKPEGKLPPSGIHYIASQVQKVVKDEVLVQKWDHNHNNSKWVLKPDSSCGMEICSPVSKGGYGIRKICEVIDALSKDSKIVSDSRCSFHVHIDISDLTKEQLFSVVKWWVKCEPVFLDSVPLSRKRNRYCYFLGLSDIFEVDSTYGLEYLIRYLGNNKYGTINLFHFRHNKRETIEFRIMESACCLDANMAKNWIKLLLNFIEVAKIKPPLPYEDGNHWSGYCWLEPKDVFEFLNLEQEVKDWFLSRLLQNTKSNLSGMMNEKIREFAYGQVINMLEVVK